MLDSHFKKEEFKKAVKENVKMLYRKTIDEATQQQIFQAVSLAVKDVIIDNWLATQKQYEKDDPKIVYYLSMEFLMGRALGNKIRSRIRHWVTVVWEDWQHVSWIPWQLWDTVHMAVVSVITMVCSNRKSKTAIR